MVRNRKPTGKAMSIPGGLAVGVGISMLLTIVIAALLAKLVQSEAMAQQNIGYGVMILLLTASFFGAYTAQGRIKHQRMLVCLLSGGIYFLVLLGTTALFFGGQYNGVGVTALVIFAGTGVAAIASAGAGKGSRKKRFRK